LGPYAVGGLLKTPLAAGETRAGGFPGRWIGMGRSSTSGAHSLVRAPKGAPHVPSVSASALRHSFAAMVSAFGCVYRISILGSL
jgi:hypothetical protein